MNATRTPAAFAVLALLAAPGCATVLGDGENDATFALTDGEMAWMLWLVNDRRSTVAKLDDELGLDSRAATNIVAHRDGADATYGTADDDPFGTLEELDAVPYVGASALQKILDYVLANPPPAPELVEGVQFSGAEVEAVLWGVNQATLAELDEAVGLDARAASNIVAGAPYTTVAAVGVRPWVGASALASLRAYAPTWEAAMVGASSYAGTFDGVSFDLDTAATALEIANEATYPQLVGAGIPSGGAAAMVANRPYADLAAVAAVSGIGPSTMQHLHDVATSGAWPFEGGACTMTLTPTSVAPVASYDAALAAHDGCGAARRYKLATWDAGCADLSDPFHVGALRDLMISYAGWSSWVAEFPELFQYGAAVSGAGGFRGNLDQSLQWLGDQVGTDHPDYVAAAALHAEIVGLTEADPAQLFSLGIHLEASEASEDAWVVVDTATGLVIVLRESWGC